MAVIAQEIKPRAIDNDLMQVTMPQLSSGMEVKATALWVNKLAQSNFVKLTRSLTRLGNYCIVVVVVRAYNP
jgi:hypothetical protein